MLNQQRDRRPVTPAARALFTAVLFVAAAAIAAAQSGFVSFSGLVADEQGRGVPGAAVILANEPRQAKYEVKTNESGRFELVGLPAGEYTVEVRAIGFRVANDAITIKSENLQQNFSLQIGTLQETIHVGFNPADSSQGADAPVAKVTEVPMPPRRECVPSAAGGQIVPPRKIRDVAPVYPPSLRGTGTAGTVLLEGRIGVDGYIGDIHVLGDVHADLAHAAIAAVRQWRYTETLLNCQPVEVVMTITVNFRVMP